MIGVQIPLLFVTQSLGQEVSISMSLDEAYNGYKKLWNDIDDDVDVIEEWEEWEDEYEDD